MDLLTHITSGYLLKKNLARNKNKFYTIFFIISAISPDIDILWSWNNIALHRVLTHSLVLSPFFALFISFIFYFFVRKKYFNKKDILENDFKFYKIFLISLSGILIHIFLDYLVVWGVPLFYPFTEHYYSLNLYIYVMEPFLFFTFLLLFIFIILDKYSRFKINAKKLFILNFLFIFIFLFRFGENYYAGKISGFSNTIIIPYIGETKDYFYLNRYKVINKENGFYNIKEIDIFQGKVLGNYKIKIYNGINNCPKIHKGFLFSENNLIGDVRYTSKLSNNNSCFTGKNINSL